MMCYSKSRGQNSVWLYQKIYVIQICVKQAIFLLSKFVEIKSTVDQGQSVHVLKCMLREFMFSGLNCIYDSFFSGNLRFLKLMCINI